MSESSKKEKGLQYIAVEQPQVITTRKGQAIQDMPWLRKRFYWHVITDPSLDIYIRADSAFSTWRASGLRKEPHFVDWVSDYIRAGDVVYDVGANVGVMSMAIAQMTRGKVEIHAFEPSPQSYGQMVENFVFNRLVNRIHAWPICLSDSVGQIEMNLDTFEAGGSLHDVMSPEHAIRNAFNVIGLPGDQLPAYGIPNPNHMKIDVDGSEMEVIKGFGEILQSPDLKTILIEVDKIHLDAMDQLMSLAGLRKEEEWNHIKNDGTWDAKDILYVRS